ncbi:TRAP transporter large permease [Paracoccus sulfuroxidans]|uniref:TRAP transporter large permease protein n=1 Tax=Paracoccus sulfuroxidans TaxID=384678 RepID=A0A562NH51_9RHOB|nr:TRAP transporter large permease subunit [Paracoccus sulfuroxidans]TWI31241.1 tripartite ATP-independent transporter DctM subunit [Paracoccus sulfuroxidans]
MEWWVFLSGFFVGLTTLMLIGIPVAIAFLLVNMVGVYLLWGGFGGFNQLVLSIDSSISTFILVPIPMFILMGSIMFHSGVAMRMIKVIDQWLGFISGRLAVLTVGAGAVLATLTGVAMGSVAMLGSTLTPEMEKRGYARSLAIGPVLGSGALAILIPPSTLAIVLASVGGFSVAKTLVAIVVPGILLALMYVTYIVIRVKLRPQDAPQYEVEQVSLSVKIRDTFLYLLPPLSIIVLIIAGIFSGVATPTESAALGTFAAFVLAACYGELSPAKLKLSLLSATKLTVMILIILTGSASFSQLLSFSGATSAITSWATALDVSSITLMMMMMFLVLVIGMFIEQTSIVLVTMPIFLPIIHAMGWDPIWFAVVMMVNLELATITPPAGLSLFVMKGVAPPDTTMGDIYRAALPFILINILLMAIMIAFPQIALWLPSKM